MKTQRLFLPVSAVMLVATLIANSSGPAQNGNRATGAPGDGGTTCVTCHNNSGGFGTVSLSLDLVDGQGDTITEYKADSTYTAHVTVSHSSGTPAGFGFQMVSLIDSDDSDVDGWSSPSANAQISTAAGKKYAEHDGISASNQFSASWTAPSAGSGSVTFYVGGNAVNGANGNGGDRAAIDQFTYEEVPGDSSINGLNERSKKSWTIYPNPAQDYLVIEGTDASSVKVCNSIGQWFELGLNAERADLRALPKGVYFLSDAKGSIQGSFIKN